MESKDKATTLIPESANERLIQKVDRRDKQMRIAETLMLLALTIFNVFTAVRLQQVISQNQANTLEARQQNIQRQNQLQGYIKCILLLRYNATPESLATLEGAEAALDACAKSSVN